MGNDNCKNITTQQDKHIPNPTGKGGFGDHPENRNPGGWKPEYTFSYQYRRFLNMNVQEFRAWKDKISDKDKTMVEELAWSAVLKARSQFKERQEIANRTEGLPRQAIEVADERADNEVYDLEDTIQRQERALEILKAKYNGQKPKAVGKRDNSRKT